MLVEFYPIRNFFYKTHEYETFNYNIRGGFMQLKLNLKINTRFLTTNIQGVSIKSALKDF